METRYIQRRVEADLRRKMVFLGGPRQAGKTTLARAILAASGSGAYFNYDYAEDRADVLAMRWRPEDRLLVFDEIHKYGRWKRWLKGLYDVRGKEHRFLATGSARLDLYRRGGDSLLGRYHYWRLFPFTLSEHPAAMRPREAFDRIMTVGGFPEPFLDASARDARRWRRERFERVVREDIRDLTQVRDISLLALFVEELRRRVGSPLVLANIARDLEIAPNTAKSWLALLERMYVIFIVRPFSRAGARAITKPPKAYFFDVADVIGDEGARFENLVALELLKRLQYLEDAEGYRTALHYIRDKEGREVDFAVCIEDKLEQLIEAKLADADVSRPLRYYAERLRPKKAIQVVGRLRREYAQGKLAVASPLSIFTPIWKT